MPHYCSHIMERYINRKSITSATESERILAENTCENLLIFSQKNFILWLCSYKNIFIPKGTVIQIPTFTLHREPEEFPDPEVWKPERFLKDHQTHNPYSFVPFGNGPRICIGMRSAHISCICITLDEKTCSYPVKAQASWE